MKHLKLSILLLSLTATFGLEAAETDSILTLDQCVGMTLANNVAVRNAANDTRAAVELRKEAFTKYFPEVSASGMAFDPQRPVSVQCP